VHLVGFYYKTTHISLTKIPMHFMNFFMWPQVDSGAQWAHTHSACYFERCKFWPSH